MFKNKVFVKLKYHGIMCCAVMKKNEVDLYSLENVSYEIKLDFLSLNSGSPDYAGNICGPYFPRLINE